MVKPVIIIRNAASTDFGGGERFPVFLSETLATQGYAPVIVSRSKKLRNFASSHNQQTIKGWWWQKQQWSGAHNLLLPLYVGWQILLTTYYLILFLRLRPNIVHIQSKDDFIGATLAANLLGIRVIWTDHADLKHIWKNINQPRKNPIGKFIHRLAKGVSSITLVSRSEKDYILQELPKESVIERKLTVIYNGVMDVSSQYSMTREKSFSYLIASRLVVDKGIGEAIDAFKKVYGSYNKTKLVIIGDGPQKKKFRKMAADCPAISFLGHQPDPLKHMAEATVFLQPSYHEGFSVALVEASMMSMPIIATNVGGNKEIIIDKKTGLLVPAKDYDALAGAMALLYKDATLRENLASNAREQYIRRFQFDAIVRKSFIPLYEGRNS